MAQVWLARRAGLGGADKPCALKLPLPHLAEDARFRRMFLAEARLAMRLSHGSIVGTFDVGEDDDNLYIAMEWVDGLDLACFAEGLRNAGLVLPVSVAAHVVGEILAALDYAHTFCIGGRPQGIIHRDVSPHNVLVSAAGEARLTDFGIARIVHEETSQEHTKGKLRYMPAEHLRGQATQRSDLFAVGAILHELLDGRKFRDGVTGEGFFGQILDGVVPPLSRRDVPPQIERLRLGLLEPDQARRIPTAEAALAMLSSWPGFRNERVALRQLVRRHLGPDVRASGLTEHIPLATVTCAIVVDTPAPRPAPPPPLPDVPRPPWSAPIPLEPLARVTGSWSDAPTTRTHVPARRGARFWIALGLAIALPPASGALWLWAGEPALSVASASPIDPAGVDTARAASPPLAPVTAEAPPQPVIPAPPGDSERGPPRDTERVPRIGLAAPANVVAADEPATEAAPAPPALPRALRRARSRARRATDRPAASVPEVEVLVVLEFIDWAEVEIDGRRTVVAPRARRTLPTGTHRIRWRTVPRGHWRDAGRLDLPEGSTHQLRVREDEIRLRSY